MSWFDSFDTYATGAVDLINRYPSSRENGVETGEADVRISAYGRGGGKALLLNPGSVATSTALIRGIDTPTEGRSPYIRAGMAVFLTEGTTFIGGFNTGEPLFGLRVAAQHRPSPNVTYYEIGGVVQSLNNDLTWSPVAPPDFVQVTGTIEGLTYRREALVLGVSSDGFLRVSLASTEGILGGEFDPFIARSTKQVPFDQWCHLELSLSMGTFGASDGFLYCWLDGELVMSVTNTSLAVEANYNVSPYTARTDARLLTAPREASGGQYFNADNGGYLDFVVYPYGTPRLGDSATETNRLDDLYILTDPTNADQPLGDLVSILLPVVADGASQDSVISGTSPAATHWQSVATDDGDVTRVTFADAGDVDRYGMDTLDSGLTVKALQINARVKKSDGGAAVITLGAVNTGGTVEALGMDVTNTADYGTYSQTYEKDALGADWTPTTVNDAELRIRRVL